MEKFYHEGLELEIPQSVYYPREDSILMAKIIENTDLKGKTFLEIGCGSGFLSITAAKSGAIVTAVDINPAAVNAAAENAKRNGVRASISNSDLFSGVTGKFDIVVFNPPYLPVEEGESDFTYAGGRNGRETIERFVKGVKSHLGSKGKVLIVISSLTGEKETIEIFKNHGMHARSISREKIPWEELIVIEAKAD